MRNSATGSPRTDRKPRIPRAIINAGPKATKRLERRNLDHRNQGLSQEMMNPGKMPGRNSKAGKRKLPGSLASCLKACFLSVRLRCKSVTCEMREPKAEGRLYAAT